jgi:hypothetical protein
MTTSLMSGLPSRETWTHGPSDAVDPSPPRMRIFWRLALA